MKSLSTKLLSFSLLIIGLAFVPVAQVHAYAPIIKGRVCEADSGPAENCKPVPGVYVSWTSTMPGDVTNPNCNTTPATRYTKTDAQGYYLFPSWGGTSAIFSPIITQISQYDQLIQQGWSSCGANCLPGIHNGTKPPPNSSNPESFRVEYNNTIDHDGDPNTPAVKQAGSICSNQYSCKAGSSHVFTAVKTANMVGEFDVIQATGRVDQEDNGGLQEGVGIHIANSTDYVINIFFKPAKVNRAVAASPAPKTSISSTDKSIACIAAQPCSSETVSCSAAAESAPTGSANTARTMRIKLDDLKSLVSQASTGDTPADNPIYIVQCNRMGQAYDCSTGNATIDKELGLRNTGSVVVKGIYMADGTTTVSTPKFNGTLPDSLEWETTVPTSGKATYSFYVIANGQAVRANGSVGGQQQGTLTFAGCTEIEDPKGIVFDSHTLEPLSGAQVVLQKERSQGTFTTVANAEVPAGFKNPYMTEADGKFSFFVPDGTYKLQPSIKGYTFPYNFTKLNKNFSQFYTNLYKGQELVQKGEIIHTDIPVDPIDKKASEEFAKNNPAKVLTYVQSMDKPSQVLTINGTVSHPRSQLALYSKQQIANGNGLERGRLLKQTQADKDGKFTITINVNTLKKTEVIGELDVKKHSGFSFDPAGLSAKESILSELSDWISKQFVVHAYQTTSTTQIEPLLNYIEGYAKDEQGKVMPHAKIQVKVPMLSGPAYEVEADASGYFKIPSDKLPAIEYSLAYVSQEKGTILLSNNTFVVQNAANNEVNYFAYKPSESAKNAFIAKKPASANQKESGQVAGISESRSVMSYVSFIMLLLIASAGGLLWVHISRKHAKK